MSKSLTEAEMQSEMTAICAEAIDRGFIKPSAWMQIRSGGGTFYSLDVHLDDDESVGDAQFTPDVGNALSGMREWLNSLEDPHVQKQREAVRAFGQSIDKMRAAGIDADFVDPLSKRLQEMSDHLLPAPKGDV